MRSKLFSILLLFSLAAQSQQQDRPWVKSRNSDTIYHTVISVSHRAEKEKTWIYRYKYDSVSHEVQAPDLVYQIDSHYIDHPKPQASKRSIQVVGLSSSGTITKTLYKPDTSTVRMVSIGVGWTRSTTTVQALESHVITLKPPKEPTRTSAHKKKKPAPKRYRWKETIIVKHKVQRGRMFLGWYIRDVNGSVYNAFDFNGTMKQWDSIGRIFIINKAYFNTSINQP